MSNCRCGSPSVSYEVKAPGPNRGKWYWKCATGRCRFFQWDNSALPFIRHPREAYAASEPLGVARRPPSLPFLYQTPKHTTFSMVNVKVVFSLISKTRIGIRAQQNLTIDPVIASIDHISWDESLNMYTIPANIPIYNNAIATLPTDIPNIQIEIETIPVTLLDNLLASPPDILSDNPNAISEVELKWLEFVESPLRSQLTEVQCDGVRLGIERRGRILFGNENGIGNKEQALALCAAYKDEWPVLFTCPAVLCSTWKEDVQNFLGLDEEEVCILDNTTSLFKETSTVVTKKRKKMAKKVAKKAEPVIESLSSSAKPKHKKARTRLPYAQRMKQRMDNNQYESDTSEESSEEEQIEAIEKVQSCDEGDEHVQQELSRSKPVKFYIASHKKVSKNRTKITEQHFRIMVCDGSHYLKYKDQNQTRNICKFLKDTPRAILMSDTAIYSLPVDMYTQIQAVDDKWFPDLGLYTQRYCNPKSTVYGWTYTGKSNKEEFEYVLDSKIWYCPKLEKMKNEKDTIRQTILVPLEKKERREFEIHLMELRNGEYILEDYIKEHDLLKKTNEVKRDFICQFMEYVFDIYKRPKIAIAYYDKDTIKHIESIMTKRKVKSFHLDNLQLIEEKADQYNKSRAAQVVLVDMGLDDLPISLYSVDLVVVVNLPTEYEKMAEVESYFFSLERSGPLTIKYLIAPETIETYLWPQVTQD